VTDTKSDLCFLFNYSRKKDYIVQIVMFY